MPVQPIFRIVVLSAALAALAPNIGSAQQLPGKHPGYLYALSDLRAARWFLFHQPGEAKVHADEDVAITEIDSPIGEIKQAAIDDGKDVNDHPAVDVKEHGSRLLRAIETLTKAKQDVSGEEDDPEVKGLRHRAEEHIQRAIHAAEKAHAEWLKKAEK